MYPQAYDKDEKLTNHKLHYNLYEHFFFCLTMLKF